MQISIAMATYNGSDYVEDQLNSFLTQTRLPDELVISDDASKDSTLDIINKFSQKAPFNVIIIENKENLGYTKNFEQSVKETQGDLILFSDQDDVWFPSKIKTIEDIAKKFPECLLFINDTIIVDEELKGAEITRLQQIRRGGYPDERFVQGACTAIRRTLMENALPIPDEYTYDSWIHALAKTINARLTIEEPLQFFRRHGTNTSNSPTSVTTPISRTTRWSKGIKEIINCTSNRTDMILIEQTRLNKLYRAATSLAEKPHMSNTNRFLALENIEKIKKRVVVCHYRRRITIKPRVSRLPYQTYLLLQFGSESYGGPLNFLKDLIMK